MSLSHIIVCTKKDIPIGEIKLNKVDRNLYDHSITKIEGFYDESVVELFNYIVDVYIISTEKVSKWLAGETEIDDFDYYQENIKNHKFLLKVLHLCTNIKCDIGSDIVTKLISISILNSPVEEVASLVNFDETAV